MVDKFWIQTRNYFIIIFFYDIILYIYIIYFIFVEVCMKSDIKMKTVIGDIINIVEAIGDIIHEAEVMVDYSYSKSHKKYYSCSHFTYIFHVFNFLKNKKYRNFLYFFLINMLLLLTYHIQNFQLHLFHLLFDLVNS